MSHLLLESGDLNSIEVERYDNILILNAFIIQLNSDIRKFIANETVGEKTLLMVTSGGADWQPKASLEVDAITSASRTEYAPQLVSLIMDWIRSGDQSNWFAKDYVLALKYYPRTPVTIACDSIRTVPDKFRSRHADLRRELNTIGYMLLRLDRLDDALEVFELNIELYPGTWNVYDSYAEALLARGDEHRAIMNYEIALKMNPNARSASSALKRLKD